jgi:hypothetical protein
VDLATTVKNLVETLIKKQKSFTAFDVTEELRANNPAEDIFHYEVRSLVHNLMNVEPNYTAKRDFSIHSGGPIKYECVAQPVITPKQTTKNVTSDQTPTKTTPLRVDSRGRLFLSKKVLSHIGNPPDIFYGSYHNGIIVQKNLMSTSSILVLKVDKYGGVKISKKILSQYLDINKSLYIEETNCWDEPTLKITN